ncbi:hypothetical protein ABIE52_006808 [Rhodococcus sp. OAS809]
MTRPRRTLADEFVTGMFLGLIKHWLRGRTRSRRQIRPVRK